MRKRDKLGRFKKGIPSENKGKTLEEIYGIEKAGRMKLKMSQNSKKKGDFLRSLNLNSIYLAKRRKSRKYHDYLVGRLGDYLRNKGERVFIISQYVKDPQPDIVLFRNGKLIAIELESDKPYKPSLKTQEKRKIDLHSKHNFFNEILFISFDETTKIEDLYKEVD